VPSRSSEETNPNNNKCTSEEKFNGFKDEFGRKHFVEHQMPVMEQGSGRAAEHLKK
jgi:hypothetical protein